MATVARVGVELVTGPAVAAAKKLENATKRLKNAVDKIAPAAKKAAQSFERMAQRGKRGFDALIAKAKKATGNIKGFGKAAAIAAAAAGAIAGLRFAFTQAGELEKQTRSLQVLTGSLEKAKGIISELQAFGAVTPFESSELIETAKRLKAFGFETNKIVDITKRLSDVAGATGADLGGIATAFGQIQAKGRLQGEELLQLQERGVALQDELRKMYGLTGEEFSKALQKGQISAKAVEVALVRLTEKGGKYANGAIAQSDTLFGKLSTLQDAFQRLGQNIGKALAPIFKFLIDQTTRLINAINGIFARNAAINAVRQRASKGRSRAQLGRFMGSEEGRAAVEAELANQQTTGSTTAADLTIPGLGGGTGGIGGGTSGGKERVDMSQKMLGINQRLRAEQEAGNETLVATLELMQRRQEIAESNMLPVERQNALEQAGADFKEKVLGIEQKIAKEREKNAAEAYRAFQDQIQQQEELAQAMREADPMFQMKQQMEELLNVQNQVAAGAQVIGNAFAGAFKSVITGSKSAEDALKDMLAATAEHFLDMAMQIIAQQITMILYGTIMKALGISMPGGGGGFGSGASAPLTSGLDFSSAFADGGFVSGPTRALIGEGGEPEYVIPQSKMRESMSRYSRGARGSSVIPENGSDTSVEGSETAVAAPIDVRYTIDRINSVDYVTADQFQAGMRQAANQGAKQGEQQTLKRLQLSSGTRKRLGM